MLDTQAAPAGRFSLLERLHLAKPRVKNTSQAASRRDFGMHDPGTSAMREPAAPHEPGAARLAKQEPRVGSWTQQLRPLLPWQRLTEPGKE